jgi:hypothetical protein
MHAAGNDNGHCWKFPSRPLPLLTQKRQAVGIFSANALKCRDRVGADALA